MWHWYCIGCPSWGSQAREPVPTNELKCFLKLSESAVPGTIAFEPSKTTFEYFWHLSTTYIKGFQGHSSIRFATGGIQYGLFYHLSQFWVEIIRANGQKVRQLSNWKRSFSAVMCPRKYWGTHHEAVAENLWLCCGGCLVQVVKVWPLSPSKIVVVFQHSHLQTPKNLAARLWFFLRRERELVEHPFEACGPNQASRSINVYCLFSITKASASPWALWIQGATDHPRLGLSTSASTREEDTSSNAQWQSGRRILSIGWLDLLQSASYFCCVCVFCFWLFQRKSIKLRL